MAVREIRRLGDEILLRPCSQVERIDRTALMLLQDLTDTLYHTPNAGGLAAPQIGILRRAAVLDMGSGLIQLINPILIGASGAQDCIEGCLSLPGRLFSTVRPQRITVETLAPKGRTVLLTFEGAAAKCVCHEMDHLDGILLPERAIGEVTARRQS